MRPVTGCFWVERGKETWNDGPPDDAEEGCCKNPRTISHLLPMGEYEIPVSRRELYHLRPGQLTLQPFLRLHRNGIQWSVS